MMELVCHSADQIHTNTAALITKELRATIEKRGSARFAIAGGSAVGSLRLIRQALGPLWGKVKLTWVDERCVDFDDPQSNRGSAYRQGHLDPLHPCLLEVPPWIDGENQLQAQSRWQQSIFEDFEGGLDVTLLGMGSDGHIASLFPDHDLLKSHSEREHPSLVAYLLDSPKPPPQRMTMLLPLLESSRLSILVATGESKRSALKQLIVGSSHLPASQLKNLIVITDLPLCTANAP